MASTRFHCFFTKRLSCPTQFFPAGGRLLPHKRSQQINKNDPLSGYWDRYTSSASTVSVTLYTGAKQNTNMKKLQDFLLKHRFEVNDRNNWMTFDPMYFFLPLPSKSTHVCEFLMSVRLKILESRNQVSD